MNKLRGFVFLAIFFLFISNPVKGQDEKDTTVREKLTIPRATLKINIPVLVIDPKHAIFLSTDTRIGNKWSMDMGIGYYFYYGFPLVNGGLVAGPTLESRYKGETFNGVRGRLGIKYYYLLGSKLAPYIGFEAIFNRYNHGEYNNDVCRFGCQYRETMVVEREVKASGLAARTGLMIYVNREKTFFFDVYAGIGYKYLEINDDLPSDAEIVDFGSDPFELDPGDHYVPNVILGIHFGYAFR